MTKNPPLEGFLLARATCRHARSHSTLWHVCRYPRPWLPAFPSPLQAARSGRCSQQASPPAIDSQRNQGHRAVQSAHPPCHQVVMYLPSAAPIEPPTCREKSRTGSVKWLHDCHQSQDFCKFASVLPPEGGVTTGKNPRSTTRNAGGVGKMGLTAVQTMPDSLHRQQNCLLLPTKF